MSVVTFDSVAFLVRYSEFSAVSVPLLSAMFDEAGLYLDNTDNSRIGNVTKRALLLYMLTAHLAVLNGALDGGGGARPVGVLNSATEGAVSASFNAPQMMGAGSKDWYMQTQYGLNYWNATAGFRTMRYIPQPTRF